MNGATQRPTICLAPGCDEVLTSTTGRGRPRLYCSPACRPSGGASATTLSVEVDYERKGDDVQRPLGRVWFVRVRRGKRVVIVAHELGRPSADHLAGQLVAVIGPRTRASGAAID